MSGSGWDTEDAPYWRRHYGIGRPWQTRDAARRGCLFALVGFFAVVVLTLLVALVVVLLG